MARIFSMISGGTGSGQSGCSWRGLSTTRTTLVLVLPSWTAYLSIPWSTLIAERSTESPAPESCRSVRHSATVAGVSSRSW
ncbi:MAG TPA: hypothetical protein VFR49_09105 [Solirubrobacteraceae bacterium]|nr:hypothetical protein [Solirubrobacteraceae bacterium]